MAQIFWGFILVFFHIRFNGFDFLPDFVGYGLILYGFKKLTERYGLAKFKPALISTAIMVVLSLLSQLGLFIAPLSSIPAVLTISIISCILGLYIIYSIIDALNIIKTNQNIDSLKIDKLKISFYLILAGNIGALLAIFPTPLTLPISLIFVIIGIVGEIMFLVYLSNAKTVFEDEDDD